jgi:hypothetical protein
VEPTDALFNVIEASLALAGFAGIVTALDQRSAGHWRRDDRDRIVNLLMATLFAFASSLLALTLIYASVASVWRVSSAAFILFVLVGAVVGGLGVLRARQDPASTPASTSYLATSYLSLAASIALQLTNLLRFDAFWPYFAGLAVLLCFGASQFARLLWFGFLGRRAAQQADEADVE